ncbi:unnamed protein product [Schistosoma turkestanicum]|nr:unnamed protein product [Schistosoma turkestanicum]
MEALLAYVDIPTDCHDAIPLLDLGNPTFAKFFKRILKKLEKGETSIQKTLPKLSNNDTEEESDYVLIGTMQEENSKILLARLPNSSGVNEIYKLPFIRFSVRRINEPVAKQNQEITNNSIEPYLNDTFKRLDDKIENFGAQLSKLVESLSQKPAPRPRPPRKSQTPAAAAGLKSVSTPKPTLASQCSPNFNAKSTPASPLKRPPIAKPMVLNQTNSIVSSTENKAKSTPIKSSNGPILKNQTLNESAIKKKQTESLTQGHSQMENPRFASMIDKAIDHVLNRIHKGKEIKIGPVLHERLFSVNGCHNNNNTTADDDDHIDLLSNHVDIDEEDDSDVANGEANFYHNTNNFILNDRNQHNPSVKPKKNVVAISPCVSFMMKPVQSSVNNNKMNSLASNNNNNNTNKRHFLSTDDYETLETVLSNNSPMKNIHYSFETTAGNDDDNNGQRKHKHKKRKHSND